MISALFYQQITRKGCVPLKRIIAIALAMMTLFLSSCQPKEKKEQFSKIYFDYFDTASIITGYETSQEEFDKTLEIIKAELESYHQLYDIYYRYDNVTNLCVINSAKDGEPTVVDQKIIDMLKYAKEMYVLTDGEMNVAMGSVLKIWHDFRKLGVDNPKKATLPKLEDLKEASNHTSIDDVIIDEEAGTLYLSDPELRLDVGAIAKGYATEMIAQKLISMGKTGYCLNIGGNIRTIGDKNGEEWRVGIENPDKASEEAYIKILNISDMSLVTSGSYQRFYVVDGKNYHHIIDKDTLYPSEYYQSVSVLCESSALADALSTSLFTMELEEGKALVKSIEGVEALWCLPDGEIITTDGFKKFEE